MKTNTSITSGCHGVSDLISSITRGTRAETHVMSQALANARPYAETYRVQALPDVKGSGCAGREGFRLRLTQDRPGTKSRPLKSRHWRDFTAAMPPAAASSPFERKDQTKRASVGCSFCLVRSMGLEPIRSPIRPSNVRVCRFRHDRKTSRFTRLQKQLYLSGSRLSTQKEVFEAKFIITFHINFHLGFQAHISVHSYYITSLRSVDCARKGEIDNHAK